jgi:energy-coupling factor transporter ATP-binding protein EcfA2
MARPRSRTVVGAVLTAASLGVAANVGTNALPESWKPHLWLAWPVFVALLVVTVLLEVKRDGGGAQAPTAVPRRSRDVLLDRSRRFWIEGVLHRSLYAESPVELGLTATVNVAPPWNVYLAEGPDRRRRVDDEDVLALFHRLDQSLLIVGAPGSGKTTLLLQLLDGLLREAAADPDAPVPVFLNLASWGRKSASVAEWSADELEARYGIPVAHGAAWLRNGQVALLLDGLDEVARAERDACVRAINALRAADGTLPVVVTCREQERARLAEDPKLYATLEIEALAPEQVREYLAGFGEVGDQVVALLERRPDLWEVVDSPLLLSVLVQASRSDTWATAAATGAEATTQELIRSYVRTALVRVDTAPFTRAQVATALTWIAGRLARASETLFHPDDLDEFEHVRGSPRFTLRTFGTIYVVSLPALALLGVALDGWRGMALVLLAHAFVGPVGLRMTSWNLGNIVRKRRAGVDYYGDDALFMTLDMHRTFLNAPSLFVGTLAYAAAATSTVAVLGNDGSVGWLFTAFAIVALVTVGVTGGWWGASGARIVRRLSRLPASGRNALGVLGDGIVLSIVVGAVAALLFRYLSHVPQPGVVGLSLVAGVSSAFFVLVNHGVYAAVEQLWVRAALARDGVLPFAISKLMRVVTRTSLMNRVGEDYIFRHRMILDFLSGYARSSVADLVPRDRAGS